MSIPLLFLRFEGLIPFSVVNFHAVYFFIFVILSWSPAGAIRAGRNSATYKNLGEVIDVDGRLFFPFCLN